MSGPAVAGAQRRQQGNGAVRSIIAETGDLLDVDSTPRLVAGVVLGSLATLILLRAAGFRFSWGVNVGAGR